MNVSNCYENFGKLTVITPFSYTYIFKGLQQFFFFFFDNLFTVQSIEASV